MPRSLIVSLLAVLLLSAPAFAATPSAGDEAPELGNVRWLIHEPATTSIAAWRGEVVFVALWDAMNPADKAVVGFINDLQQNYGERGLHVFTIERSNFQDALAQAYMHSLGVEFPTARGSRSYISGETPHGWLIRADGIVAWEGGLEDGQAAVQQRLTRELAKITYPGLLRQEFTRKAAKAAKAFAKGDMVKARTVAEKLLENEDVAEDDADGARYILARIDAVLEHRQAVAAAADEAKRYALAIEEYMWIAKAFKRTEAGDAAKERLKELSRDDQVKIEIAAAEAWIAVQKSLVRVPPDAWKSTIEQFENAHPDTQAAADAKAMRESF